MRVFISADMEGTAGVVAWDQTTPKDKDYDAAVALMVAEVNAAIEGALEGGATYVLVNDSHNTMRNLRPEVLHPAADLLSGGSKPLSMAQGLSDSFDAAIFTGYHGMAGDGGVLNHTYWGSVVQGVRLNGRAVGETGINAAVAGYFGVPVAMVTGDEVLCAEATALLPDVEAVCVKTCVSQFSAVSVHPEEARRRIRAGAARAVARAAAMEPFTLDPPVALEMTAFTTGQVDRIELVPGVRRTGGRSFQFEDDDLLTVFRCFLACCVLAGSAG